MPDAEPTQRRRSTRWVPTAMIRRYPVLTFFVLACVLSWAWWLPIATAGVTVRQGDPWPTQFPGLLGPLLAAFTVTAIEGGRAAVRDLWARMLRWRGGWRTVVLALSPLLVLPVVVAAASLADGGRPHWRDFLLLSGVSSFVPAFVVMLVVVNGFGEETGWRGFAQHRRRTTATPRTARARGRPAPARRCRSP